MKHLSRRLTYYAHLVTPTILLALIGLPHDAISAQLDSNFNISVKLRRVNDPPEESATPSQSTFCNQRIIDSTSINVICVTGEIIGLSSNKPSIYSSFFTNDTNINMLQINLDNTRVVNLESYQRIGTKTSWRQIKLLNWDYVEMLVEW